MHGVRNFGQKRRGGIVVEVDVSGHAGILEFCVASYESRVDSRR